MNKTSVYSIYNEENDETIFVSATADQIRAIKWALDYLNCDGGINITQVIEHNIIEL